MIRLEHSTKKNSDRTFGFTLVELLVVVVIIAVLAAIAVPIFLNQKSKATESAREASVSAMADAIAVGQSTGGTVVVTSTALTVTDGAGSSTTVSIPANISARVQVDPDGAGVAPALKGTSVVAGTALSSSVWCVSDVGSTGNNVTMANGSTKPNSAAADPCYADAPLNGAAPEASGSGGGGGSPATASYSGGTLSASGSYTVHTFTTNGTFTVSDAAGTVDYLVVGGGGGGGSGGGGGVLQGSGKSLAVGSYAIVVGVAGSGPSDGTNSVFSDITATGGKSGSHGGVSGNGFGSGSGVEYAGGAGWSSGGGGGAGGPGGAGNGDYGGGAGGNGIQSSISGTTKWYGYGGEGSNEDGVSPSFYPDTNSGSGGTFNDGYDGIVIIRHLT